MSINPNYMSNILTNRTKIVDDTKSIIPYNKTLDI